MHSRHEERFLLFGGGYLLYGDSDARLSPRTIPNVHAKCGIGGSEGAFSAVAQRALLPTMR